MLAFSAPFEAFLSAFDAPLSFASADFEALDEPEAASDLPAPVELPVVVEDLWLVELSVAEPVLDDEEDGVAEARVDELLVLLFSEDELLACGDAAGLDALDEVAALVVAEGDAFGVAVADAVALAVGVAVLIGVIVADALGDAVAEGVALGVAKPNGVAVGATEAFVDALTPVCVC